VTASPNHYSDEIIAATTDWWVTFGTRYSREPHPTWPLAHPDGYLAIHGADHATAVALANGLLDRRWAFMYPAGSLEAKWAPRGELGRITLTVPS
jgi:hypothetical protein